MKLKVKDVIIGNYGYDSIKVVIDKKEIEICFPKSCDLLQYKGGYVELVDEDGCYKIKE